MPGMADHHEVFFGRPGELITIRTETFSPIVFTGPTLEAAKLVLGEPGLVRELPGLYDPD
jgi:dihydrodipicolinate reductase